MKIAVTYDNGEYFSAFWKNSSFLKFMKWKTTR